MEGSTPWRALHWWRHEFQFHSWCHPGARVWGARCTVKTVGTALQLAAATPGHCASTAKRTQCTRGERRCGAPAIRCADRKRYVTASAAATCRPQPQMLSTHPVQHSDVPVDRKQLPPPTGGVAGGAPHERWRVGVLVVVSALPQAGHGTAAERLRAARHAVKRRPVLL